jgi:hypothetical protein
LERDGIFGAADGPKPREVLKRQDWISEIDRVHALDTAAIGHTAGKPVWGR